MCGIAAWLGRNAVSWVHRLLLEQQHRGHDAAGIAVLADKRIIIRGGSGFLWEAIEPNTWPSSPLVAIGHVRYSTSGPYKTLYQPVLGRKGLVLIAFNGNIVNFKDATKEVLGTNNYTWDAKALADIIEHYYIEERSLADAVKAAAKIIKGAYSLVALSIEGEVVAARDPRGFHPLAYTLSDGYAGFASETAALSTYGFEWRELGAGELIYCRNKDCAKEGLGLGSEPLPCAFEYIYFLRPDSVFEGVNAHEARKRMGWRLADKDYVEADIVAPVPDSGRSAAIGYAERKGIAFEEVLYRNRFIGRVFITAPQNRRHRLIRKFHVIPGSVKGKKVVLVDDSIVRGDTSSHIVAMLREAGAHSIHLRSAAPPIISPCFFGIDMPTRRELIAYRYSIDEIRSYIGVDSLMYNTVSDIVWAIGRNVCLGCFTARYPLSIDVDKLEHIFSRRRR